jgi:DNA-binding IscR family transcriptional regulator
MVPIRFAVATHMLLLLAGPQDIGGTASGRGGGPTSFWLAAQVRTNPVVVRRINGQLARAGLVRVRRGVGGAFLARPAAAITLEDIWQAVSGEPDRRLLALHLPATTHAGASHAGASQAGAPQAGAPQAGGERAQAVLAAAFGEAEAAFRGGLRRITLGVLAERLAAGAPEQGGRTPS